MRKKLLASFLSLCMVMGLASAALADTVSEAEEADLAEQQVQQIVNDSSDITDAEMLEDGNLTINEQVIPTGTENEFELRFDVTTAESVTGMDQIRDAAVLIVVDKSSSMEAYSPILLDSTQFQETAGKYGELTGVKLPVTSGWDSENKKLTDVDPVLDGIPDLPKEARQAVYNCYHRRAWFERKAVIDFLDSYTEEIPEGANRYFALASFYQKGSRKVAWTSVTSDWRNDPAVADPVLDYGVNKKGSEPWNTDTGTGAYDKNKNTYTNGAGSNIEAAYILADNLMNQAVSTYPVPAENAKAFLITDGEPTNHAKDPDTTDTASVEGTQYTGAAETYGEEQTANIRKRVDNENYDMNVIWYGNATLSNSIYNLENGHENFADNFYDAGTDEQISDLEISSAVLRYTEEFVSIDPWVVTVDHSSEWIRVKADTLPEGTSFSDEGILLWDLKTCEYETLEDGSCHYQLNYGITLDNTSESFDEARVYATNKKAFLSYTGADNGSISSMGTAEFEVPTVKGYHGSVELVKQDDDGNVLAGAEFRLTDDENCSWEAVSDDDGAVRFENIPSGREYTLTEVSAPEGYKNEEEEHEVRIQYGSVTFDNDQSVLTVVNSRLEQEIPDPSDDGKGSLTVSKTVSGYSTDKYLKFMFTITLTYPEADEAVMVASAPNASKKTPGFGSRLKWPEKNENKKIIVKLLSDGDSYTISDLPEGTEYKVTESDTLGFTVSPSKTISGVIQNGETAVAAFHNTRKRILSKR